MRGHQPWWCVWLASPYFTVTDTRNPSESAHCIAWNKSETESSSSFSTPTFVQGSEPYAVGDPVRDVTLPLDSRNFLDCSSGLCAWHIVCDVTLLLVFNDLTRADNMANLTAPEHCPCPGSPYTLPLEVCPLSCPFLKVWLKTKLLHEVFWGRLNHVSSQLDPSSQRVLFELCLKHTVQWVVAIYIFILCPLSDEIFWSQGSPVVRAQQCGFANRKVSKTFVRLNQKTHRKV